MANIHEVGLKKLITVVRRSTAGHEDKLFDLVCGQGRIEALIALGETQIPSIVIEAPREDQFLMSLVENIARRRPSHRDILREVRSLRDPGVRRREIAKKFGMERMYISGIVHLVEHEEVALIASVEAGKARQCIWNNRRPFREVFQQDLQGTLASALVLKTRFSSQGDRDLILHHNAC